MILKHAKALNGIKVVLASASPRRKDILGNVGLTVEVCCRCDLHPEAVNKVQPSTFEEDLPHNEYSPAQYATATAKCKALDVAKASKDAQLIIASDTVVEKGGHILEKAADVTQATEMLTMLSGDTHQVHTEPCTCGQLTLALLSYSSVVRSPGVVLVVRHDGADKVVEFSESTTVRFAPITAEEIQAYIETGEPWGKAGAYGIQGAAGAWVEGIQGCYFNVMGFPIHRFSSTVARLIDEGVLQV